MEPLAKVIVLTKNEVDLIDDFVDFYAAIFGYENIVIVDNDSSEPLVLESYKNMAVKGVTIISEKRSFHTAHSFMTEHIQALKGSCEYILPLETDEFLFLPKEQNLSVNVVHDILRSIPDDVSILRYGSFWGSVVDPADKHYIQNSYKNPPKQMTNFYDQDWDKIILRAKTFDRMQLWCHKATCNAGNQITIETLGLLHYHDYGFRSKINRSCPVIESYQYIDFNAPIGVQLIQAKEAFPKICGHKVRYYELFLRRKILLLAFQQHTNRLPSVQELDYYCKLESDCPERLVLRDATFLKGSSMDFSKSSSETFDSLLYHDESLKDVPYKVYMNCQVSDFFATVVDPGLL